MDSNLINLHGNYLTTSKWCLKNHLDGSHQNLTSAASDFPLACGLEFRPRNTRSPS